MPLMQQRRKNSLLQKGHEPKFKVINRVFIMDKSLQSSRIRAGSQGQMNSNTEDGSDCLPPLILYCIIL